PLPSSPPLIPSPHPLPSSTRLYFPHPPIFHKTLASTTTPMLFYIPKGTPYTSPFPAAAYLLPVSMKRADDSSV
ncbi:hypothetical protein, partial [Blautia sp.]|uniref:hypothetical protein n=1 Tax=Blautia sp. TaxID=1955243 RepID=UPI003996AEE6